MNKPEILTDGQVVEWLTTNRGEETLKSYRCGGNPVNSLIVERYGREAQRDADAAYYAPLIEQVRREVAEEIFEHLEDEGLVRQSGLVLFSTELWEEIKAKYLGESDG